jgi:glycosyltransferase involved in cell wall biosynthesis
MTRMAARGMFFLEDDRKFFVRGVSYGPFRDNQMGEPFPEKRQIELDFRLLAELGANTLRVYHVPPSWVCELADAFGLRLLVGIPWQQHIRFLDSERTRAEIRTRIRTAAHALASSPNLLGLLVGNEISPQIVRWYRPQRIERFIAELADEARQAAPEALVSYANYPMTEYLELDFLDFASFNVYLHRGTDLRRYLGRLQNLAAFRPLVLTEFGADSLREGEQGQAEIVTRGASLAAEMGCAGSIAFSFTDEWHTGGHEVEDWAFGLVTRDRQPKPSFSGLQQIYRLDQPTPPDPAPRVSVVICAYNAERTIEECLESLGRLRYPDYEVIVVDDGSTDQTRAIAERYPAFRLISQPNMGLSFARNVGIRAATAEIVAFTDADCAADPDWLTFLVRRLVSEEFAAVGGPNLPPPEDHWVPEAVARSPGGPTHVLITDWEAEHVPGCNMAFWRRQLLEVGAFDPIFRTAGDDVDVCWRLQNAGHRIGFAAAALVWHRRRHTVRNYLTQQAGYGRAEGMLYFKHPHRFNLLGHSRWAGRIYSGDRGGAVLNRRPLVYGGPFGMGLFQTLYEPASSSLRGLPLTLEWNLVALGLLLAGIAASSLGSPLPTLWAAGVVLLGLSVAQAAFTALRVNVQGLPVWKSRALIGALNYLGPFARATARTKERLIGLGRLRHIPRMPRSEIDLRERGFSVEYWNETGIEKELCVWSLVEYLKPRKYPVLIDDGWQPWDIKVLMGTWVRAETTVLVENHGGSKRQVDVGVKCRQSKPAFAVKGLLGVGALLGAIAGSTALIGLAGAGLLLTEALLAGAASRLSRTMHHAIETSFRSLPLNPMSPPVHPMSPPVNTLPPPLDGPFEV